MRRLTLLLLVTACPAREVEPGDAGSDAGSRWHAVLTNAPAPLLAAHLADDGVVTAVGGGVARPLALRHDDAGWWSMDVGVDAGLWWVHGFSSSEQYAVGERGTVVAFDGQRWRLVAELGDFTLYGIWGASPRELWVVGGRAALGTDRQVIFRSSDAGFVRFDAGLPPSTLFKVWGRSASDVYFSGDDGLLARWDGQSLRAEDAGTTERLVTVFGSASETFAVGGLHGAPVFLRRATGGGWAPLATAGVPQNLNGGAVAPDGGVAVVGWLGYVAAGSATALRQAPELTADYLHGAAAGRLGFVAVGGDLFGKLERGVLLSDGELAGGPLQPWPFPAAPRPDAGRDAGVADAGPVDAGPPDGGAADAGESDGGAGDAGLPPGARCELDPSGCALPDQCWYLFTTNVSVCARECATVAECGAYGPNACCRVPGPQTLMTVCLQDTVGGCDGG